MVGELARRHALSEEMVEGVSERTGGVPLFVEEVTRLLLERGEQGGAQAIPPTLQQSLAARLDRLGAAREVAQIGAVLGRDFSYALLATCRRPPPDSTSCALQAALERLAEADILFVEARLRPPTYRFKHALIQDAAYDSLLKSRRQALHRRAAEVLRDSATRRARSDRPSFHRGRPRRSRDRMVGQGGRPGAAPLGLPGGDRPSRQGDRDGGQGGRDGAAGGRRLGRSEPATDAVARRLRQRADRRARLRRAGNDGSLRKSPRVGVWRQGRAGTVGGRLRPVGRQLRARRTAVDAGARGGLSQRRRGETRFARGRRRSSRRRDDVLVRRRVSRGAGSSWNARSPCSNPAATTIWPFASDMDPGVAAMLYLAIALWPLGEVERAISLVDSAQARIAAITHVGTLAFGRMQRPCSN